MGNCIASREATNEEKQYICKAISKDLMNLCVKEVLAKPGEIKIQVPPSLDIMKKTSAQLRVAANDAKKKLIEEGGEEGAAAAAPQESGGGGLMGAAMGLFNKATDVASELIVQAADMSAGALSQALSAMADALDSMIAKLEDPMTSVGKDIVTTKQAEVQKALEDYIAAAQFNATELCYGEDSSAISKQLFKADTKSHPCFQEVAKDAISKHTVITAWKNCTDSYNEVCKQIEKMKLPLEDFQPDAITLDIEEYICVSAVNDIGRLIGLAEAGHRQDPVGKGSYPELFEKIFKKRPPVDKDGKEAKDDYLTEQDYTVLKKKQSEGGLGARAA